jgi:heme a synthase
MSTVSPFLRHALPAAPAAPSAADRAIAAWLLACCVLVFAIIVVGGITRLTHSGLSITEWQPIVGTLPPLSDADWQLAFDKYRQTPEYLQVNKGMTLDAFKRIYWWEYAHRLLGRLVGVVFFVPLVWFAVRRRIPRGYGWKLVGIFALGALQGALGWYMVKSGLVDDPRVSQFRLAAHLTLAFLIFGAMLWVALSLLYPRRTLIPDPSPACGRREHDRSPLLEGAAQREGEGVRGSYSPARAKRITDAARSARRWAIAVVVLVLGMVVTGGFVAGIRAGFAYNTFPLMNGAIIPREILMLEPAWKNFFWNMATVQFDHRLFALLLVLLVPALWWKLRQVAEVPARAKAAGTALLVALAMQVALGVATLVLVVPLPLAALHQAGAVLVFALALYVLHALAHDEPRSAS